jgi:uncharacterized membrane protein YfcA
MEIFGYFLSIIIGFSLGLIGGGGSVLTVPVLVYLMHVDPVMATAYSLFIVGTSSLAGTIIKFRQGLLHLRTAVVFGVPSVVGVYTSRALVLPLIPQNVLAIGSFQITKPLLLLLLFAALMIAASVSMIRQSNTTVDNGRQPRPNFMVTFAQGLGTGLVTGLVGAGGGFLIIPALVLFGSLSMKQAAGTSLLIIAASSLVGFSGDLLHYPMNWKLIVTMTVLAIAGVFIGNAFQNKIPGAVLKRAFGWVVLVMGIFIIVKELLGNHNA